MIVRSYLVLLSILVARISYLCQGLDMGKAQVLFKYAEPCPDKIINGWNSSIKSSKISRSKTQISVFVGAREAIDEKIKLETTISVWSNGGWKPNFYRFVIKDLCATTKRLMKKVFLKMAKDSNIPPSCPLKSGPLYLNNFTVNMDDYVHQPVLPYGKMKAIMNFNKGRHRLFCIHSFIDIIPA